ncbi:sensor histidine kinase [Lachnotalea sp. AF33-28]|uniref:sensor histidine kinase n=1 Tax=Lachnotalea sp. AF33-28 TaxID=2292046 RepID=UPI000E4CF48C|nr:sensor histidine kinase [Lachnotalea sp. AF33-28]RHP29905.1 sensor histidine kinase [Lachnotalea sp. AF33-28]
MGLQNYLKSRGSIICGFFFIILCYGIVYFLYYTEAEAFIYGTEVVTACAICVLIMDYMKYLRRHASVQRLLSMQEWSVADLPDAPSAECRDDRLLLERLLERNKDLISQADRARTDQTDYYTMWTHQIKTPLFAMKLLIESDVGITVRGSMEQELFKTQEYVDMALQYLRIQSMSNDLEIRECSLKDAVHSAVKKYSVIFIHKKLKVKLDQLEVMVLSDEKWLVFAIEQILSNALKYTEEGGVHIYCMEKSKMLFIEDTGIGIRSEDLPRIFDKGFTGYNGRSGKKSTGIGLYLCRQVLDKLGNTVSVESEPGRGTRFCIDLNRDPIEIF